MRTARSARRTPVAAPALLLIGALLLPAGGGGAQTPAPLAADSAGRALSIEEALRIAESQSEAVQVARAGVERARGQQLQARSQYLPQLNAQAVYTRTLETRFEAFAQAPVAADPRIPTPEAAPTPGSCLGYLPPQGTTPTPDELARAALCRTQFAGGGIDFTQAGFGARNQYQLGLAGSINLYTGGRVQAQNRVATASGRAADVELRAQRAQLALDVTQAYYDAVLAGRLLAIADSTLVQTEGVLRQVRLARQVGNQSEFELLRAQVTRDNVLPQRIQARTQRDLSHLRLKQLLNLPLTEPLRLTSDLSDDAPTPAAGVRLTATGQIEVVPGGGTTSIAPSATDTVADERATVRQAAEAVRVQEAMLRAARGQRLPAIQLSTQYGRVAFPVGGLPDWNRFLSDWTVSVGATMPLFTGGRIKGETMVARADLEEARARLQQTREFAALDAQLALAQLTEAEATWAASAGTAEQASRAYSIAEVRYREGISTQVELSESRLLLQQASANRAQAARDLQVARVRLALLRDLPLQAGGGNAQQQQQEAAARRQQQQQQQQQQQRQQQQQQQSAAGAGQVGQ